jgi:glycosyltransferase involved in cell wall biosynthesis
MLFSVIVPVFNRPDEIEELLGSLCEQTYSLFEVIIVEDGSEIRCDDRIDQYRGRLDISYYYKENSGQGFSRNYGFERAKGDYFVVFDSDCIIPTNYFETVKRNLSWKPIDAWGGPDRSHQSFSPIQKAIGYAMTSPFTTGGIRGNNKQIGTFHPRSFNMGISREVYKKTGGYKITRMGEDLEFSIRIIRSGFRVVYIDDAFVYHKRRTNLRYFYNQLHFFGRARINIQRFYPDEVKAIHILPAIFVISLLFLLLTVFIRPGLFQILVIPYLLYTAIIMLHAYNRERNFYMACLSAAASWIQLFAYGTGFLSELYHDGLNVSED